jgi:uncharacterized phage-associated protein
MDRLHFKFDYIKGTQALNFFASKEGGHINKMKALKLVYFADRYHLRKYGRLITNDSYVAMEHGPVPSSSRDIIESSDYLDESARTYAQEFLESSERTLSSVCKLDTNVLSDSDIEALEFAWKTFGHMNQFELRDQTHNYPEWKKFKKELESVRVMQMNLLDFLKDPQQDIEKCFELSADDKVIRKDQIVESAYIESLWE